MTNKLSPEQLTALTKAVSRDVLRVIEAGTAEQLFSAEQLAALWDVEVRSIANYAKLYEESGGREGLGPKVFLSHKAVRYRASDVNRFIAARTLKVAAEREQLQEASAS